MSKLIELDAAIEALKGAEALSRAFGYHAVIDAVEALPTVDAAPVVRCRDCKHHDGIRCFRWNSTIITGFDDFCSNGERKDGDHHD